MTPSMAKNMLLLINCDERMTLDVLNIIAGKTCDSFAFCRIVAGMESR
jgi:hypothetical protein